MNTYSFYLETIGEYGVVEQINHPIVYVEGLPLAKPQEIVVFETGQLGQVFTLDADRVEILVFSREPVNVKSKVVRTNRHLSINVGKELLGTVIDPLGQPLTRIAQFTKPTEEREIDIDPLGISQRTRITKQLTTGTTLVDMMIPLGKGQKELVIGDRKTGKTAFLLTTMKSQIKEGTIAIYAAIGKKINDIKKIDEFFTKEGLQQQVIIVAASSYEAPSLIYLTPLTAMTIAEYFRDQGQDVVLILDDLSTHAKFYREIALLAKRFPGRDSYPGDISSLHGKLLERAGNFKHETKKEASITCFPIAETTEGDFSSYIVTNLMGITDGHIFFDSNIYSKGRRPAINISLSVTRVGRQTQRNVKRHITRELNSFFSAYDRMQIFSHFGSELTDSVRTIIKTGDKIYRYFDQPYDLIVPEEIQLILFTMLWYNLIDDDLSTWLNPYRAQLAQAYQDPKVQAFLLDIINVETFNDLLGKVSKNKDKIIALCKKNTV